MTLAIARLNVSGENRSGWLNGVGDPHRQVAAQMARQDRLVARLMAWLDR
jgi:hypothetical protein